MLFEVLCQCNLTVGLDIIHIYHTVLSVLSYYQYYLLMVTKQRLVPKVMPITMLMLMPVLRPMLVLIVVHTVANANT